MVIIPGADGLFGVLPGHVPIITELKPGVVTVQVDNTVDRYFVSSGFAFVHPDSSTEVCALEAVKVSELDADAIRVGLEGAKSSLASASDGNSLFIHALSPSTFDDDRFLTRSNHVLS